MGTFHNYDATSYPIIYANEDWNSLLDFALIKAADYIIYLSGSQYRGVHGTTGKLTYSGSAYATVRNSVTGSLTGVVYDKVSSTLEGYVSGVLKNRISITGSSLMEFTSQATSGSMVSGVFAQVKITGSTYVIPVYAPS